MKCAFCNNHVHDELIKKILFISLMYILSFFCFRLPAYAISPSQFPYRSKIVSNFQDGVPARVSLGADSIAKTSPDGPSVRVYDDKGIETQFVILPRARTLPAQKQILLNTMLYTYDNTGEVIELENPDPGVFLRTFVIHTPTRNFKRKTTLLVSSDRLNWKPIATDILFDYSSRINFKRTSLSFSPTQARYFRIEL